MIQLFYGQPHSSDWITHMNKYNVKLCYNRVTLLISSCKVVHESNYLNVRQIRCYSNVCQRDTFIMICPVKNFTKDAVNYYSKE